METTNASCLSLNLLGKIASVYGNGAAARTYHEQSLELASKRGLRLQISSGLEGLARAGAAQGEPLWAARLWGAARALRDSMGTPLPPIYRADYERSVATARLELGAQVFDAAWSEGHAMTAEQLLGSPGRAASLTAAQADQSVTLSLKPTRAYPAVLTSRESEVLRLVAQGLTDGQVAERLVISPRTVNTHFTSIFSKIGVSSRGAVTGYALQHHLA